MPEWAPLTNSCLNKAKYMNEDKGIMKYESVLPADFDGIFKFTNATDEDFVGVWGGVGYRFPAQATSPMIMPFSPLEIQHIRKKFARDLAEREFYKSTNYETLSGQEGLPNHRTMGSIHQAATYSLNELEPYIQQCLEPLPVSRAEVAVLPKRNIEDDLHRDDEGEMTTEVIAGGPNWNKNQKSLRKKALEA